MRIALTGATGFLGRTLAAALLRDGHDLVVLTRRTTQAPSHPRTQYVTWTPGSLRDVATVRAVNDADAVVHLAGESMAARRWSPAQKERIRTSRIQTTHALADAIRAATKPPAVFVSASAVGYYGPRGDETVTEATPPGSDFVARLCVDWEGEALTAASERTRVVVLRTGLVVEPDGGALQRMLLPFRLGVGGRLGSGRQYWSWIHREDWIAVVGWAIATPAASGALNATAPAPVTNAEFAAALGRALDRPAFLPVPAFALRLLFGEMADALLLSGQRVMPERVLQLGFRFRYPDLPSAFRAIFGRPPRLSGLGSV